MSIEFGTIHNLVRTYQRVLKLPRTDTATAAQVQAEHDRLSISAEAREHRQHHSERMTQGQPVARTPDEKDRIL